MDGLEVFRLDAIPAYVFVPAQYQGEFTYRIFDKTRIVVGLLGNEFFVGSLERP